MRRYGAITRMLNKYLKMIYQNYQLVANLNDPIRLFADNAQNVLQSWNDNQGASPLRKMTAYYEQIALLGFTHKCPPFNIGAVLSLIHI